MKEKTPVDSGGTTPAMFAKRLQDTSTREGTMIQLKCQVTGNPPPEVAWLFENKLVEACQDKRITMKSGVATLTILSVQMEDAGLYACEISNGIGSKMSCTCKVAVNEDRTKKFGGKIPHFDKVIKDAQTIPGNRARFDCIARGNPKPKLTWFHDKVPVLETDNIKFTNDGNNYQMEIMRVSQEDTGIYICKASNSLGERDCSATLSTGETGKQNETPKITEPPSFTQVAKSKDVKEGAGVSFEFKFIGSPQPTVVWKFNGKSILRANRVAISQPEPGTARLAINSVKASDAGEYTCVIYNSEGEKECSVDLTLQGVPNKKNPDMGRDAKKAPVEPGEAQSKQSADVGRDGNKEEAAKQKSSGPGKDANKTTLEQEGVPNKKNPDMGRDAKKAPVEPEEAAKQKSFGPGKKDANKTTLEQAGAANKKNTDPGKDAKKTSINQGAANKKNTDPGKDVKKTTVDQVGATNKKNTDPGKDVKKPSKDQGPSRKPPPAPKIDPKSRTLSWEVETNSSSGHVRYIIEARKKGEKSKEWKQIANNLKEPKYSIKHLDPKTAYIFRVRTESDSGISEPSEEIDMSAQKEDDVDKESGSEDEGGKKTIEEEAPGFLDTTEEVYALDNEDATLECNFTGYPPPKITWMQDDEILHSDDHFVISIDQKEGKTTLTVKGVTYDDIGEYECIAVNDKGYADCRLYLDVAEPPKFVELFESREIPFGYSLRLDCRLDGIPEPDVVWYKDDMPLKQSGRVKYLFEGEDGASLLLENFTRSDCGEYSIRAHNMAGSITHSAMVTAPGVNIEPVRRFRIKTDVKIEEEYDILEELGRGAYGIVHRALDRTSGLERAAKFITIKAGMWEEVRNEIKIMGMLSHKRLIGLYDAYETPKQINMAMELVTGGELFERIVSQDTITEGEAVFFLKQVIDGVSHMHERNVVHLDLKPENILLESADSDNIKVIDFGLARVLKPDEEIQCACGTPEFVAPEVVRRKPITPASDVWSIGVIAYILLSGCSPFMGEDDRQTLMNVRDGDWEFEEDIWDNISEEAKDFIRKVLVVDVEERYNLKQCLEHPWLKFDERRDRGEAKISTERLKNFNSRRKWRKALNAVKSMMRLRRLSSLIRKEEAEEKRQAEEAEKSGGESQDSDSLMSSPFGSEPRTPLTPRLEPLVEEEAEQPEERALPSKDINHNEVVENSLSEKEGSIKHSEENEKITVNNLENAELPNGPRMSASSENDIEVDIPVDHVYGDGRPVFIEPLKDAYLFEEGTLLLTCEFRGHPQPKITWYRGDQVINRRANHIQCWREAGKRACLRIVCISIEEGGFIRCVAENSKGKAVTSCRVDVAEEPDVPSRPKVPLVSSKEAFLTWKTDHQPGKPDITGYTLMFKEYGEETWQTYESDVRDAFVHITNLKPNTEYRFRAASITQYGKGQLSKPSILVKTHPDGSPALSSEMIRTHTVSHSRTINYNRSLSMDSMVSDIDEEEDEDLLIHDLTLKKDVSPTKYYDFLAEIDRGRFSIVKKCRKKANSREYAAKIMRISDREKNRCFEEHSLLSDLKHTNIVQLRDAFQTASHVILIMGRYFAGDILKHLTRTDFFTEESVANFCLQILDALQYLKLCNVLYLDLRHDNLLIESRRRDRVRLVDFGAARKLENKKRIVLPRQQIITEFMSPEVVEGSPVEFGTDIWGLGVLLFTWLSGTAPFLAKTEEKMLFNITRPRCNMDQIQDIVSPEARDFLKKIFVRNPSQRITVTECFDHPWLHCSPEMIEKRSHARLISRRLRKYRNDYRARVVSTQTTFNVFL